MDYPKSQVLWGAAQVQYQVKKGHKKRAGALCSGFHSVLLKSVFNYWYNFIKVSRYAAAAVINAVFNSDLHIEHAIGQLMIGHLALNWCYAGSSADKICYLIRIKLPAHQRLKGYNFGGLIRPPSCLHGVRQNVP